MSGEQNQVIDVATATFADSTDEEKAECWAVCWAIQDSACEAVIAGRYAESKRLFEQARGALNAYFERWG